jgi:hypothetical protein
MISREWKGYSKEDRAMIKEIVGKVCDGEKLTDDEIGFLNERSFHAIRSEISRDGQDLAWDGSRDFTDFVAFLMTIDD